MNIDASRNLVTLVVTMQVDPSVIDERLDRIREMTHQFAKQPGFVANAIHKSVDNSRIVEYIQWESIEHVQAVAKGGAEALHPPGFALSIDLSVVDVVEVVDPSDDG